MIWPICTETWQYMYVRELDIASATQLCPCYWLTDLSCVYVFVVCVCVCACMRIFCGCCSVCVCLCVCVCMHVRLQVYVRIQVWVIIKFKVSGGMVPNGCDL